MFCWPSYFFSVQQHALQKIVNSLYWQFAPSGLFFSRLLSGACQCFDWTDSDTDKQRLRLWTRWLIVRCLKSWLRAPISSFEVLMGVFCSTEWLILCWCAVKKLLTHWWAFFGWQSKTLSEKNRKE